MTSFQAQTFTAILKPVEGTTGTCHCVVPFSVAEAFGTKALCNVRGTINGTPFRGCLMPDGRGAHFFGLKKALCRELGVEAGSTVSVVMERDFEEKVVTTPEDVLAALDAVPSARVAYEALAKSHKREYVEWIEDAKKEETRRRRIAKMIDALSTKS